MATAPTSFFPTTVVPPPPCSCGAPAYSPCSFSPAVAYPPPGFPGSYQPSPFPFYSYPPAFPSTAAYHHSEIHTQIGPNWSPAAPTPIHGDLHHHHRSPPTHDHLPVQAAPQPNAAPTAPSRESLPAQSRHTPDSRPPRSKTSRALGTGEKGASKSGSVLQPASPNCQGGGLTKSNSAGGVSVADEKFVCEHSVPGIFSMPNAGLDHRLDTHQSQFQSSLESLLGELSKLSTLVSQFTVVMDRRTTEAPITESSGCTRFSSAPSMFSAAPTYVAPQVLDEMPTPQSGYENCYGYPNQIQSSCMQGGSTNLSEQYLDELPHYYGFENLKSQSVFLANGTERSFYALPEEYPLKQVTPPMSPSARKNVGVTSPPSVTCLVPGIKLS